MGRYKGDAVLWKCGWIAPSGKIFQTAGDYNGGMRGQSINAGMPCDAVTPAVGTRHYK